MKEAPAEAKAWYDLAFALRQSGQASEAARAYRRYVTLRPQDADAYYGLGRSLVAIGNDDDALVAFKTYVKLETRSSEQRWVDKARTEIARIEGARKRSPIATPNTTPTATPTATASRTPGDPAP